MRPIPPLAILTALLLAGCASGEARPRKAPVAPAQVTSPEDATWLLAEIDGKPVQGDTRMVLTEGVFNGQGPCNSIRGKYERSGEDFSTIGLITTQRICPLQAEEDRLIDGLLTARTAQVADRALTLSSPNGPTLTFRPEGG